MLNFDDFDPLVKLKIKNMNFDNDKKLDIETKSFYNSLYSKNDLSSFVLIERKVKKIKKKVKKVE